MLIWKANFKPIQKSNSSNMKFQIYYIFLFFFFAKIVKSSAFWRLSMLFQKVTREINRMDITIQPFSHKSLILIIISFKGSVISFIQNRNQIKDKLYTLGVSPSLVSRYCEGCSCYRLQDLKFEISVN